MNSKLVVISIVFLVAATTNAEVLASFYKSAPHHLVSIDHEGYPLWFSGNDRKLISQLKKGDEAQPNAIVAKDGSGQYKTITDAINSYPKNHQGKFIIYVKAGIYEEYVTIDKRKHSIILYGDGPENTVITGNRNSHERLKTSETATFSTLGRDFIAKSIGFENTAGPTNEQAVALYVLGDRSAFFDCAFRGFQDTLCVEYGRQFYHNCSISGTIDFIFGRSSTTLIQNSKILVRKPNPEQQNVVVADGTDDKISKTGIVLQNCTIMPDVDLIPYRLMVKTYLARPWKEFSRAVFINNYIDDFIQPEGYMIWNKTVPNTKNSYFVEFGNTRPGANATRRAKWAKCLITKNEAAKFTAEPWLQASTWLPSTDIPYSPGFEALS